MKKKVLVIPSWYPNETDKINGSFFQEQALLMSEEFDVKVLFVDFSRPPYQGCLDSGFLEAFRAFVEPFILKRKKIKLPNDKIFQNPPLIFYSAPLLHLTIKGLLARKLDVYLDVFQHLRNTGWVPDIIHAHSVNIGGLVAHRIKEKYKIPYVITEHMPFALCNYSRRIRADVKKSFEDADRVLSLSSDKVRQIGMSGIEIEPNIVYNYVDESVFNKVCNKYQPGEQLSIVSIGAASFLKDHITMLRAVKILKESGIPFKLMLIGLKVWGNDDTYRAILDFIKKNDLSEYILIVDKVDRSEIPNYLSINNVFLITSIAEGLPVSVLEAMASGLTVVATRHGGTEDVMSEDTGYIVEIKHYRKIAEILIGIYNGKKLFDPLTIRKHIVSVCGANAFSLRMSAHYNSVINNQR
jgi:glycosyltransferase involved in cell wall biosynthesis